ncbi:MAG TPA: hypothetical protein V6C99_03620 [Oculatellaceae cyanobacterium]
MTDLIRAIQQKVDVVRATVVTRSFQFEGNIHCPRIGKGGRLLTNLLNSPDRRFIVLTDVTIINRANGKQDPHPCKMLQINMEAIEFIRPADNQEEDEAV